MATHIVAGKDKGAQNQAQVAEEFQSQVQSANASKGANYWLWDGGELLNIRFDSCQRRMIPDLVHGEEYVEAVPLMTITRWDDATEWEGGEGCLPNKMVSVGLAG